jgi:alanyl-tRNA synthetase
VRHRAAARAVVLGSATPQGTASIAAATDGVIDAVALVRGVASLIAGGGGGSAELALAGGKRPDGIDEALQAVRGELGAP